MAGGRPGRARIALKRARSPGARVPESLLSFWKCRRAQAPARCKPRPAVAALGGGQLKAVEVVKCVNTGTIEP